MTMNQPKTLVDWLDDLTVRFLLNLPPSELSSVPRLCFQVEEAQWFYEDFVRPAVAAAGYPPLPSLHLRQFCLLLFQHCPLLSGFTGEQHLAAYEEFLAYKVRVPVRGAIMLDETMEKVLLVRGWKKGASWSFPRGKINKDERDLDCAVREVYEETGFDARQAGVVPENDDEAKFIDITMREQHMRLFVFRGIPESTHFEPKTRKEIGAIQWYAIKDLPGFKKQKGHETMSSSKFYMVAPFLTQLKKWISQQRKLDKSKPSKAAIYNEDTLQTATEDDEELEIDYETGPEVGNDVTPEAMLQSQQRSVDLMRLLSGNQTAQTIVPEQQPKSNGDTNNLLAMLQGTVKPPNNSQVPQTPLEQMTTFPPQPQTPQPDHLRHPSISQQQAQPPPHFPLSPQQIFHQQRQQPPPGPHGFASGQNGHPVFPQGLPGIMPPHMQQPQYQQMSHMPGPPPPPPPPPPPQQRIPPPQQIQFTQPNGQPFNAPPPPQQIPAQGPFNSMQPPFQQRPPSAYMAQGPQGVIAGGPAVPNANQLPPPTLNAQSMRLLNAFSIGAPKPSSSVASSTVRITRPTSTHQTALLDLLKKPSAPTPPVAQQSAPTEASVSPTLTDATEKPPRALERRTTLNEFTRTLPTKFKPKSPPGVKPSVLPPVPLEVDDARRPRPKSGELFDPTAPKKVNPIQGAAHNGQSPQSLAPGPPAVKPTHKSPRIRKTTPASSPGQRNGSQPAPPFTILARPGSARGPKSPAPPQSPLRQESSQQAGFQPQLLKRSQASESEPKPADKTDYLLALFNKEPPRPANPTPLSQPAVPQQQPADPPTHQAALLGLFNNQPPSTSPKPPSAPRLAPSPRPSSTSKNSTSIHHQQHQPNHLLNLLTSRNPSSTTNNPLSPGTPISPFTLGGAPPSASAMQTRFPSTPSQGPMGSRAGSGVGSPADGVARSPAETPTEAKQFLRGFLDGVVKKEGFRGVKGASG